MTGRARSSDDAAEWELLRAAFDRYDPVPRVVRLAAERAGDLIGSTTALPMITAGMRGDQVLRFAGATGRIVVEIESTDTVALIGIARDVAGQLWVRWPAGERRVVADGPFTVDGLPKGPLSFVVRRPGLPDAASPWFVG